MAPKYFTENAYSIYPKLVQPQVAKSYKVDTPETSFQWKVYWLYNEGKKQLFHEEYGLALDSFKELSYLILKTVHPKLPADPNTNYYSTLPLLAELLDPMLRHSRDFARHPS